MKPPSDLATDLRAAVRLGSVDGGSAAASVGGRQPAWQCTPADVAELQACLRAARAHRAGVVVAGGGRGLQTGRSPTRYDVRLSTRSLDRIVAHEADDMTLVVEAGATLDVIDDVIAPAGQRLPIDPPNPERTTVGGMIAADAFGLLRSSHGKVRDSLIGIAAVLADGTLVHGGGRVVKNVAGYDVMKLLCGSFGTLAVVVEACFRLRPRPQVRRLGWLPCSSLDEALARALRLHAAAVDPAYARVLCAGAAARVGVDGPTLATGLEGSPAEVDAAAARVDEVVGAGVRWADLANDDSLEAGLRHAQVRDRDDALTVRMSLPVSEVGAAVAAWADPEDGCVAAAADVSGGLVHLHLRGADDVVVAAAAALREAAFERRGFAAFVDVAEPLAARLDPWGRVPGEALMQAVKRELDPGEVLSPGRFLGGRA